MRARASNEAIFIQTPNGSLRRYYSLDFIGSFNRAFARENSRPSWLFIVLKCRRYDGREQIFFFHHFSHSLHCSSSFPFWSRIFRHFFDVYRFTCASEIDDAYVVCCARLAVYNRNAVEREFRCHRNSWQARWSQARFIALCGSLSRFPDVPIYRSVSPFVAVLTYICVFIPARLYDRSEIGNAGYRYLEYLYLAYSHVNVCNL